MNTLIAYDSSSEEDEPHTAKQSTTQTDTRPSAHSVQTKYSPQSKTDTQPIIGPSIPSNMSSGYDEYYEEYETETEPTESERDMIRYLTPASHPMTEIPSSPPGSPDAFSSTRLKHFLDLKVKGIHFNEDLARKSAFKNPSLLQTLMERAGLDSHLAYRTSLPSNVFDAALLPAAGYKESLLQSQQTIRAKEETDKKALAATGKRTIDFTSGSTSIMSNETSSTFTGGLQKRPKQ